MAKVIRKWRHLKWRHYKIFEIFFSLYFSKLGNFKCFHEKRIFHQVTSLEVTGRWPKSLGSDVTWEVTVTWKKWRHFFQVTSRWPEPFCWFWKVWRRERVCKAISLEVHCLLWIQQFWNFGPLEKCKRCPNQVWFYWNSPLVPKGLGCFGLYSDVSKVWNCNFPGRHFDKPDKISAWLKL